MSCIINVPAYKSKFLPLGRKPRTLTTTLTFPPGDGLGGALIPLEATITLSRDLNDGLEAVDCNVARDIIDTLVAAVLPLDVEVPEIEPVDECAPWSRWSYRRISSVIFLLFSLNNCLQRANVSRWRDMKWWYMKFGRCRGFAKRI